MADFSEKYIELESGCWLWQRYRSDEGYGICRYQGKLMKAHRVSYLLFIGDIPSGMLVRHTCDNAGCVNPQHLVLGTDADNMRDRDRKGRQSRGENHGSATFKEREVRDIRALKAAGYTAKQIAKIYGAPEGTVSNIYNGHTWGWLK